MRWFLESLQHLEVIWRERIKSSLGSLQSRNGFCESLRYILELGIDSNLDCCALCCLSFSNSILRLDLGLLSTDNFCFLIGSLSLLFDNDGENLEFFFEFSDILTRSSKLDDTSLVLISLIDELTLLLSKHALEELDQFKERLRSRVDCSPLFDHDLFREFTDLGE